MPILNAACRQNIQLYQGFYKKFTLTAASRYSSDSTFITLIKLYKTCIRCNNIEE
ncbi:hypothetical protein HMPREF0733_12007 [Rothia dentocariosa ATCC 17931]|uniref:Uncharacterized protein n=1 Tax=Rothia dentocariosa (strain ATCC 17931 / CDC X599 / XDIA) TaxID=762948 RepID=E3H2W1_ROTDC|nr:hypothetical protein HMPREF0733_12007 [Rothia dentocariosa ATCC 17931]